MLSIVRSETRLPDEPLRLAVARIKSERDCANAVESLVALFKILAAMLYRDRKTAYRIFRSAN